MTRGYPHLLRTLAVLQVGLAALAALGQMLFMGGNPGYLVLPAVHATLLMIAVARAIAGRRWALICVLTLEAVSLVGYGLSLAAGALLPWVSDTVNLTGLLTSAVLPATVLVLAVLLLAHRVPAVPPPVPAATLVWPGGATVPVPAGPAGPTVPPWGAGPAAPVTRILPSGAPR